MVFVFMRFLKNRYFETSDKALIMYILGDDINFNLDFGAV